MRRIPLFATYLIALGLSTSPYALAAAQEVKVRGGTHDGYTRLVFDWPAKPDYSAQQSGTSLTLIFKQAAAYKVSGADPGTLERVSGFTTRDTSAQISFPEGKSVRHFVIGSRLIVDIRDGKGTDKPKAKQEEPVKEAAAKPQAKAEEKKPEAKTEPKPVAEPKAEDKPVETAAKAEAKPETKPEIKAETKAEEKPAAPAASPATSANAEAVSKDGAKPPVATNDPAAPQFGAHMINITATQAVGVAVFERFGNLWIVLDEADYPLAPQIAGPQKDKFTPFEPIKVTGATAFRLKMPEALKAYGEGGGLIWKIILTPTPRKTEPRVFAREFDQTQKPGGKLLWPSTGVRRIIDVTDPDTGDVIKVATVASGNDYSGDALSFVEFNTLASRVGLALTEKIDDLEVKKTDKGVTISRPAKGLAISRESDIATLKMQQQDPEEEEGLGEPDKADEASAQVAGTPTSAQPDTKTNAAPKQDGPFTRIYAFDRWQMGGPSAMKENQRIIMSALAEKTDQGKAEDLITLGKMELSNGRGPEALGYIEFAAQLVPDLATNPEYIALRGASQALLGQYDRAFKDFSDKSLETITEIKYWKAFCLAELEDWKQAEESIPKDTSLLGQYPEGVRIPLALTLAEVFLRAGKTGEADIILSLLQQSEKNMSLVHKSALDYLRGESLRQQQKFDEMKEVWEPLANGKDDLYRAKAGLALTAHLLDKKETEPEKAIDKLEGLRYAWRGDELETAINYKLGRVYLDHAQPIKGLTMLRQAASLAPGSDLGKQITGYMSQTFRDLYLTKKIDDLNPIDAVTIYDEFSELIPVGAEGDKIARQLAERLVDADLLPRAENLLQKQVSGSLTGQEGAEVALRLTSIQLLDGKPEKALETLNRAGEMMLAVPLDQGTDKRREIALLRARALSDMKKPEEAFAALALLPQEPDVLRLRADIAWRSKRWQDAADTLEDLVGKMNLDLTKPLEADQADAILNWAVALYLADNRYVLANLREKYSDPMAQTPLAKKFEVVTRPRQNALLADRNTINTIVGETDIFKGFLDTFSAEKAAAATTVPPAGSTATPAPAPAKPPEVIKGE